ncbi:MAG: hypothetical protein RR131_09800, partial [Anaerovorax sp.]
MIARILAFLLLYAKWTKSDRKSPHLRKEIGAESLVFGTKKGNPKVSSFLLHFAIFEQLHGNVQAKICDSQTVLNVSLEDFSDIMESGDAVDDVDVGDG